ncbi:MAG TPA: DinB family protein [Blastocatellia bacterium]|nr:DinB family protein [Blastocatellia bacterium]
MNVRDLEVLYDYSYWADRRLFQSLAQLSPDQFTQPVAGSYGSIRNTLVHTLSAEWGWLDRCGGPQRGPRLNPDDYPDLESLVAAWNKVEVSLRDFLKNLKDEELHREIEFTIGGPEKHSMPLGHLLQHAVLRAGRLGAG